MKALRHTLAVTRQRIDDRGPRRRGEFFLRQLLTGGKILRELGHGRRGHGHEPVSTVHETASEVQSRSIDLLDAEIVEADGRPHDIDDGVHGPDLMERDFLGRLAVHLALGLRKLVEHGEGLLLHRHRHR